MTPSERIKTIKEIAEKLSSEEWSLIDLTLKSFNLPIEEVFNGNTFNYVMQQIQESEDNQLIDLAGHLDIEINSKHTELKPAFWKEGYLNLFISHLASDKVNAQDLKNKLEKYAISGFVAHSDIEPTREWQNEIELSLRTCDALVALMIVGFHESKWTDQEIGLALGRDLLIIPVRMGQDPYGFIGKFQAISYSDMTTLAEEIFISLVSNKKTSKKMAESIIYKFENSESFAEAKRNIGLVERIQYWDKKLIERLEHSKGNNSQISGSFGVPSRIINLLHRNKNE